MFGDGVGQSQKLRVAFDQERTRSLIAAIFGGLFANTSALVFGNAIKAIFALFTAREDPASMELTRGAAAVGFAAFAAQKIEGALDHRAGALEGLDGAAHGREGAAESLPEVGSVAAQSVSLIYLLNTAHKHKKASSAKKPLEDSRRGKLSAFTRDYGQPPHCLNRSDRNLIEIQITRMDLTIILCIAKYSHASHLGY